MTENYDYKDLNTEVDEQDALKIAQQKALTEFNTFLESDEFKSLDEFNQIKAMMNKMGVQIKDPKPSCKHCHGRGWTGRKSLTNEPIMCTCVQPDMNFSTEQAYEQRAMLPKNRSERRRMFKAMTKKQGNFTKKVKSKK